MAFRAFSTIPLLAALLFAAPAAADPARPCGNETSITDDAADQCQQFRLTDPLKNEKQAREAHEACLEFFKQAYEGRDLLCEYRVAATSFALETSKAALANDGDAHAALQGAADISAHVKAVSLDYAVKMEKKLEVLHAADRAYEKKLQALRETGHLCLADEFGGTPCRSSMVPGIVLYGMGRASFVHSLVTFRKAAGTLQKTAKALRERSRIAGGAGDQMYHDAVNLSTLVEPAETQGLGGDLEELTPTPDPLEMPSGRNAKEMRELVKKEDLKKTAKKEGHELSKKSEDISFDDVAYSVWKVACRRALPCWLAEFFYVQATNSSKDFRNSCRVHLKSHPESTSADVVNALKKP